MRGLGLVMVTLGLAAVTGCDWESGAFQHDSTLYTAARGVVLHDATDTGAPGAQVGMSGTTCEVDTEWGTVSTDYDYPGSDDAVHDVGTDANGDVTVVVVSDKGVHLQDRSEDWGAESRDFEVEGVEQARLFEDGAIAIRDQGGSCSAVVVGTSDQDRTIHLKPELCEGVTVLETDPIAGRAWIGSDAGLWEVDPEVREVTAVSDEPSSLTAYDPRADVLYTAAIGGSEVRAIEHDGAVRWSVDVGGTISSLDDLGAHEAVAVAVAWGDGTGAVLVLDAWTGEQRTELALGGEPGQARTSRDGSRLALVGPNQVDFFTFGSTAPVIDWAALAEAAMQ